jgi:hypothetical protein
MKDPAIHNANLLTAAARGGDLQAIALLRLVLVELVHKLDADTQADVLDFLAVKAAAEIKNVKAKWN